MDTKEKILQASLELFSREGYEAASIADIAGALGISKGAIYKHYDSKQEIFDNILRRMERERQEKSEGFTMPWGLFDELPERYKGSAIEKLCAYCFAQFLYWTVDEFGSRFRKMLSLERYRSGEMNSLYQKYMSTGPLKQVEKLLRQAAGQGLLENADAYTALELYAPIYEIISMHDGGEDSFRLQKLLEEHLLAFVRQADRHYRETYFIEKGFNYSKSKKYSGRAYMSMMMGPNPLKVTEELLAGHMLRKAGKVCDLGCGRGLTSLFLAKEYGFKVWAADLWTEPEENQLFFETQGLGRDEILAVKADAMQLPFELNQFDGVVSIDAYHYFGSDKSFLDAKLLPCVKRGGFIYIAIPGLVRDIHDNIPRELLLAFSPEELDYLHDVSYWRAIVSASRDSELLYIGQMEGNEEVWQDWLEQDNSYARKDRRAIEAGAGKYLNFIKIVLRKR